LLLARDPRIADFHAAILPDPFARFQSVSDQGLSYPQPDRAKPVRFALRDANQVSQIM
jgi:hypothetical protein